MNTGENVEKSTGRFKMEEQAYGQDGCSHRRHLPCCHHEASKAQAQNKVTGEVSQKQGETDFLNQTRSHW